MLAGWHAGTATVEELKAWLESARAEPGDTAVAEVLAELDLLEVHLLLPEDVPALLALLASDGGGEARAAWARYRAAIDLDARSKRLRKIRFYRPFCR